MSTETNKDEEYIEGPISIDLQYAVEDRSNLPSIDSLLKYATAAITGFRPEAEITIRIVEPDESHQLNLEYRGKDRPTNVLSFPATEDDDVFFFDDEDEEDGDFDESLQEDETEADESAEEEFTTDVDPEELKNAEEEDEDASDKTSDEDEEDAEKEEEDPIPTTHDVLHCPKCGAVNTAGKFCGECGTPKP